MTGEELQHHRETVAAILKHIDSMTREELIDMLAWRPEGYQPENVISTSADNHANGNSTRTKKSTPRKQRSPQVA